MEEVETAVCQMHHMKAPEPDDVASMFYRKYWKIVGKCVIEAVLHALRSGTLPSEINHTFYKSYSKKELS